MSTIKVPIKKVGKIQWGDLSALQATHEIIGERVKKIKENYSFAAGHRVRLYKFRKAVHFKISEGMLLDIASVAPGRAPRRQGR